MKKLVLMMLVAVAAIACETTPEVTHEVNFLTTELTIPAEGTEDFVLNFNANTDWTATIKEDVQWAAITPAKGVAGDATIEVIVRANDVEEDRSFTIEIVAGTVKAEVVITQEALFVPRLIAAESVAIPTAGGNVDVVVNATVEYTIAVPEDATWLTYTVDGKKITFTAPENTAEDAREALVTLSNTEYNLTAEIKVVQDGTCKLLWAVKMDDVMNRATVAPMFSTDEKTTAVSIALYDGNVVLSAGDGSELVKLNKETGEKVGTIATGDFKPYSIRQDDAGNLVMANRLWNRWIAYGNWFRIAYLAPGATEVANVIADVDEEYIGVSLNARGDVSNNGVVVTPHQNGDYVHNVLSVFVVTDGTAIQQNVTMSGFKGVGWAGGCFGTWPHNLPGVALVGPAVENGAIVAAYESNIPQFVNLVDGTCTDLSATPIPDADNSGNFAPTGMDIREINGKSYLAVAMCSFWSGSTYVQVYDAATQALLYTWADAPALNPYTASDTNYDYMSTSVTIGEAEGGIVVYIADKSAGTVAAKFFTVK